jgi:sensor domain CHASE-containing protein
MASCLEVAVIASLEVDRKVTVLMFPSILAQFLALWFILEFALEMRSRKSITS